MVFFPVFTSDHLFYPLAILVCVISFFCPLIASNLMFQVDAQNSNGNTPLHIACLNGQDIVISELMSYGASVNVTNKKGIVSFLTSFSS